MYHLLSTNKTNALRGVYFLWLNAINILILLCSESIQASYTLTTLDSTGQLLFCSAIFYIISLSDVTSHCPSLALPNSSTVQKISHLYFLWLSFTLQSLSSSFFHALSLSLCIVNERNKQASTGFPTGFVVVWP